MAKHTIYTESPGDGQHDQGADWQNGDIAFLKGTEDFNQADYDALIESGYLHQGATRHPVIILEHSKDYKHFLITTVSAYCSSKENDFLPPWKQSIHRKKSQRDFRAFNGSEKPISRKDYLELVDGQSFPKFKTSWVYTPVSYVVPSSVLSEFDKTIVRLRMDQMSLKSLLWDMKRHRGFAFRWKNDNVLRMLGKRLPTNKGPVSIQASASSLASDSKPATPKPSKPAMTWAAVARSPYSRPRSPSPQPMQRSHPQNPARFVTLRPSKSQAVQA
ncbi:hypothetical protein M434DRAFT_33515 [Hypoxylon sp. CO27-5]|nr:hypothetical protein M434DRAFT_33515 [Hypoxylon sp. CO27-5]